MNPLTQKRTCPRFSSVIMVITAAFVVGQSGCQLFDGGGPGPMFLDVEDVLFRTGSNQGAPSHNFRDVWVYADGKDLGVYEWPVSVPVLSDGTVVTMTFLAGIRNNGINSNPIQYPFIQLVERTLDFTPGENVQVIPEFEHFDEVRFVFIEDFEGNHIFQSDVDGDPSTSIQKSSVALYGLFSGRGVVSAEHPLLEIGTATVYPTAEVVGSPLYLELDYKTDVPVEIGYNGLVTNLLTKDYVVGLVPQENWNKVYIELTGAIGSSIFDGYQIIIRATHQGGGEAEIFVDNLKLIHF